MKSVGIPQKLCEHFISIPSKNVPLRDISILVTVAILDEGHSLEKFVSDFQGENMVMVYGVLCHFQQYFSYIVAVSFILGGNQSTEDNHFGRIDLLCILLFFSIINIRNNSFSKTYHKAIF